MNNVVISLSFALAAATASLSGCAHSSGQAKGVETRPGLSSPPPVCIAIGGGLDDANAQVFQAMTAKPGTDKVVVVAYATASFEGAGARFAQRLARHNWSGTVAQMPDVLSGQPAIDAVPAAMQDTDLIFFTGGDQSRIMQRMAAHPPLKEAVTNANRNGVVIAGTSAGAAFMSDPMFITGGSESALAGTPATDGEPESLMPGEKPKAPRSGPQTGPGMGLVMPMIDSHFNARGRYGRMVAALEATGKQYGIGVDEDRAVVIKSGVHCVAMGPHAGTLIDVRNLSRSGLSRTNIRVSLMSDGDTWVYPGPSQPAMPVTSPRTLGKGPVPVRVAAHAGASPPNAWGKDVFLLMLKRLAADPATPQTSQTKGFNVTLSADEKTRFGFSPQDPDNLTVVDARLDIVQR